MPQPTLLALTKRYGSCLFKGHHTGTRKLACLKRHEITRRLLLGTAALVASSLSVLEQNSTTAMASEQPVEQINYRILPPDFFSQQPLEASDNVILHADNLSYDSVTKIITAQHNVELFYQGFTIRTDKLIYDQINDEVVLSGNVRLKNSADTIYIADRAELTNNFKSNFVQSLIVQIGTEGLFVAKMAETQEANKQLFKDVIYTPCQTCVQNGETRRGWRIRAASILRDGDEQILYLKDATFKVLGVPIAWVPVFAIPDPLASRKTGFLPATLSFDKQIGFGVKVPYFWALNDSYDLTFTPASFSRQGLFGDIEWRQALKNGQYNVRFAAIDQNEPDAFSTQPGNRKLRGGILSSGAFRLVPTIRVGWDAAISSDRTFFKDYDLEITEATNGKSEIFAQHLAPNSYFLVQAQDFVTRDIAPVSEILSQPTVLPKLRASLHKNSEIGEIALEGAAIGVTREADYVVNAGGVDHLLGAEGTKLRGTLEGSWRRQVILNSGLVLTPVLGLRADIASYDGGSSSSLAPDKDTLINLSPVTALEARLPLISINEQNTVILEPIVQVVARPDDKYAVGITNEESIGFVLDDSNIFNMNRLYGFDRIETGIWTNYGLNLTANFGRNKWLRATVGQSRHLAGDNVFNHNDHAQSAFADGFDNDTSNIVAGFTGSPFEWLRLGTKISLIPDDFEVGRLASGLEFTAHSFNAGMEYSFVDEDARLGANEVQHEVTTTIAMPLAQYFKAHASLKYDLSFQDITHWDVGLLYNDGYAALGLALSNSSGLFDPDPDDLTLTFSFDLKQLGKGTNAINLN